jgi:Zn-dependent peptidase ImmA (M78 family)/transcriptional regulator with XRE-family HTH domain
MLGVANGAVSMLENGRLPLDESMLRALARTFDCSPDYLTTGGDELLTTRPWLRAYADASKKEVDRMVADSQTAIEAVTRAQMRLIPDTLPLFHGDLNDDDEIEAFASEVRASAGLSAGDVVGNSMRTAERLGVVLLPMDDELGRHMGLSLRVDGTPVVRVSRPSADPDRSIPGDRQRFTVAHELGHLGLHHSYPPPDTADDAARIEKQAHRFAGAFLAPGDALLEDLHHLGDRVTLTNLAKIKETWGIAIKALVVRFQNLGVVSDDQARSLYKQISARRWNKHEPVPVGNESAVWFTAALEKCASRAGTSMEAVTDATGLGPSHYSRWVDWSPARRARQDAEVLAMPSRGSSKPPLQAAGGATVTHLSAGRRR